MELTHGAEVGSDCRQCPPTADLSFYYFPNPPFRLSFHLCVSRCTGVFPVGSSAERGSSEWSRVRSAAVVLRGFVNLPLSARGQHYVFYLSFTTGGGGSVSLITPSILVRGPMFGVSLRLQMQEEPMRGTRRFSLLLLLSLIHISEPTRPY